MATDNHRFSRAVPRDPADEYVHDPLFSINRRVSGLNVNAGHISGSHVVEVGDDPPGQLDDAIRAGLADLLGGQFPYARAGFVRGALRPASQGAGRGRFR